MTITMMLGGKGRESRDAAQMLALYQLDAEDLERVRRIGEPVVADIEGVVDSFYAWLSQQPFFSDYFSDPKRLEEVMRLQHGYWRGFFAASVDDAYVVQRRTVGATHARIGLAPAVYLAAMNVQFDRFARKIEEQGLAGEEQAAGLVSMGKLLHLDTGIVMEEFTNVSAALINQQSEALMEMSTPVTEIWDGVLMLPIVGIIDSKRSMDIMNAMLDKIAETGSKTFILDIGGVGVVDTAVANHLIKITRATSLMGCRCVISGVSPAIAQTIVELGIEVGDIMTRATLRDALGESLHRVGVELRTTNGGA